MAAAHSTCAPPHWRHCTVTAWPSVWHAYRLHDVHPRQFLCVAPNFVLPRMHCMAALCTASPSVWCWSPACMLIVCMTSTPTAHATAGLMQDHCASTDTYVVPRCQLLVPVCTVQPYNTAATHHRGRNHDHDHDARPPSTNLHSLMSPPSHVSIYPYLHQRAKT